LQSVAYTLQTGRQAMDERLGTVGSNVDELVQKLRAWLAGDTNVREVWRGRAHGDAPAFPEADEDLTELMRSWSRKRKFGRILNLWVRGLSFDWTALYGDVKPRRVPLPTYPFA